MKFPKRRYVVAAAIFLFAGVGLYVEGSVSWPIVALVGLGAMVPTGAHGIDQLSIGRDGLEVDGDGQDGGKV